MPSCLSDILKGSALRGWILVSTVLIGMCVLPMSEPKWWLPKACTPYHPAETPQVFKSLHMKNWRAGRQTSRFAVLSSIKRHRDSVSSSIRHTSFKTLIPSLCNWRSSNPSILGSRLSRLQQNQVFPSPPLTVYKALSRVISKSSLLRFRQPPWWRNALWKKFYHYKPSPIGSHPPSNFP